MVPCGVAKEYRIFLVALVFLSGLDEFFSGSRTRGPEPTAELGALVAWASFKARCSSNACPEKQKDLARGSRSVMQTALSLFVSGGDNGGVGDRVAPIS